MITQHTSKPVSGRVLDLHQFSCSCSISSPPAPSVQNEPNFNLGKLIPAPASSPVHHAGIETEERLKKQSQFSVGKMQHKYSCDRGLPTIHVTPHSKKQSQFYPGLDPGPQQRPRQTDARTFVRDPRNEKQSQFQFRQIYSCRQPQRPHTPRARSRKANLKVLPSRKRALSQTHLGAAGSQPIGKADGPWPASLHVCSRDPEKTNLKKRTQC